MSTSQPRYSISVVEPHPQIPSSQHYISTGRGGAGNAIRTPSNITSTSTPFNTTAPAAAAAIRASLSSTRTSPSSTSQYPASTSSANARKYSIAGRGGAGNAFPASERAIFSFDEELERQLRWERDIAPVYHVGRGGAGNVRHGTDSTDAKSMNVGVRRLSDDGESVMSANSGSSRASERSIGGVSESGADVFNRSVKRGWKKITGVH